MLTLTLTMPDGVSDKTYEGLTWDDVITYLHFYKHYKHSPTGVCIEGEKTHLWFRCKSPIHYNAVVLSIEEVYQYDR